MSPRLFSYSLYRDHTEIIFVANLQLLPVEKWEIGNMNTLLRWKTEMAYNIPDAGEPQT